MDQGFNGVGLMNLADYGYAVGSTLRESCLEKTTEGYDSDSCASNNWLFKEVGEWVLEPTTVGSGSSNPPKSGSISSLGGSTWWANGDPIGARPSVYLTTSWSLSGGDGSNETPYIIAP